MSDMSQPISESTVRAMVNTAVDKQRGAPVGAYMTINYLDHAKDFEFIMVGPNGSTQRLLASQTDQERLETHWQGFVANYAPSSANAGPQLLSIEAHSIDNEFENSILAMYGVTIADRTNEPWCVDFRGEASALRQMVAEHWGEDRANIVDIDQDIRDEPAL